MPQSPTVLLSNIARRLRQNPPEPGERHRSHPNVNAKPRYIVPWLDVTHVSRLQSGTLSHRFRIM